MMNDGRILYNRWEYVDKGAGAVQSLWACAPTAAAPRKSTATTSPPRRCSIRPGRSPAAITCSSAWRGTSPGNVGAIVLVDLHKDKRTAEAMTVLTPGSLPKGNWGLRQLRNGRWMIDIYGPWYCDPFPLGDAAAGPAAGKFFLVSCNPEGMWNDPAGYGIYLFDVFGNRVPIYRDPNKLLLAGPGRSSRAPAPLAIPAERRRGPRARRPNWPRGRGPTFTRAWMAFRGEP